MIKIHIPNNNINERKYIIDVIFDEFLGLDYEVNIDDSILDWKIELENNKKIIIKDYFFSNFLKDLEYLKLENIPQKIDFTQNQFIIENDIPVIYGDTILEVNKDKIVCGIDIFASSFFMLSRFEEYVNKNRDEHNRFPAYESLAFKNDFLNRPVVNEYVEMLWNMLSFLDVQQGRKIREFSFMPTHDVDFCLKYKSFKSGFREILGDIIKRRDIGLAFRNLSNKIKTHLKLQKDPFDTFDWLMDISEAANIKSYFFFMGQGQTSYDNHYKSTSKFIKKLIKKIKDREHYIGMHPTYNAYNNPAQFRKEKQELEKKLDANMAFGRQHYLRFSVPDTWQVWEDNSMEWDSTLSYAGKEGFRCGVCYDFSVFNILTRNKLNLKEIPLIVMEGSFITYQKDIFSKEIEFKIKALINRVKKYNGAFVFLWHNSSFNTSTWLDYKQVYVHILDEIK